MLTANRGLSRALRAARFPGEAAAGIEAVEAQPRRHRDVGDPQLSLRIGGGSRRRERRQRRGRHGVAGRQKAEDTLVGAHLLGHVLAADIKVEPAYTADRAVELDPGLAEAVVRQFPLGAAPHEKGGDAPWRPGALLRCAESRNRVGRAGEILGQILADEMEAVGGDGAERVVRLLDQLTAQELADVTCHSQVKDEREAGAWVAGVLQVAADQVAAEPLPGPVLGVVLVGRIVEQPLVLGVKTQRPQGGALA